MKHLAGTPKVLEATRQLIRAHQRVGPVDQQQASLSQRKARSDASTDART